jgi:putative ABC transport system permease protein
MNFMGRAFISLRRGRSRTVVLALIFFVMGNVMTGALAISEASQRVSAQISDQLGSDVAIRPIDSNLNQNELWSLPESIRNQLENHPYVTLLDEGTQLEFTFFDGTNRKLLLFKITDMVARSTRTLIARGVRSPMTYDLATRKIEIVEGRNLTEAEIAEGAYVAVISIDMARENRLNLGDTLKFRHQIGGDGMFDPLLAIGSSYELTIVGFFKANTDEFFDENGDIKTIFSTLYVPQSVVDREAEAETAMVTEATEVWFRIAQPQPIYPRIILDSSEHLTAYKRFAQEIIADDSVQVVTAHDAYDSITAPMQVISLIAQYVLVLALVATILSVTLTVLLFLRDRITEIGIYGALGESKIKTVAQFLIEVVTIAVMAGSLSLISGQILATNLTQSVVKGQIAMIDEAKLVKVDQSSDALINKQEVMDAYTVSMEPSTISMLFGILVLSAIGGSLIPLIVISSVHPKRTLGGAS